MHGIAGRAPADRLHDVIVVGAGIAGLAAAWRLRDRDILVLEADTRPGGRIFSTETEHGILNFGAHMFSGPGTLVGDLCHELDLALRPIDARLMAIGYRKTLKLKTWPAALPFTLPLAPLSRLSLARAGLRLRYGSAQAAKRLRETDGLPWADMTERRLAFEDGATLGIRLGHLHPETADIITAITERCGGDPSLISAGHGLRSFANVWSSTSPGFHLKGGSSRLPEALARQLGARLRLRSPVSRVEQHEGHVAVAVGDPENTTYLARAVIVAIPAPRAREIIAGLPADVDKALAAIRYGPFLSMSVNTTEETAGRLEKTYAVSTPDKSFSVLFNQSVNRFTAPGHENGGSLMMFSGAERAASLMLRDDQAILDRFMSDLTLLLPELEIAGTPIIRRWPLGAPYAFPGRAALQPTLTRSLGPIALAGDYLEFANMEAAIDSGYEAARRATMQLLKTGR